MGIEVFALGIEVFALGIEVFALGIEVFARIFERSRGAPLFEPAKRASLGRVSARKTDEGRAHKSAWHLPAHPTSRYPRNTMGNPAAKQGDKVSGMDTHIIMIPSPGGPVPTPTPMPFVGTISGELSSTISIDNMAAATKGSTADNMPQHIPAGGPFQKPPGNKATIQDGSTTVFFEDKPAARMGDPAMTCNDPADAPNGTVIASSTVLVG